MIEDNNVEIDAIIEDDSVNLETDLDYRGERGPVGETPDITIGKVDTLSPEDNAYVEIEGTKENITLNFGIPKGITGDIGPVGPIGPSGVYIGSDEPQDPEVDVWIDPTVNPENYVKEKELDDKLNSMIESGELIGPQGPQGVPGKNGTDGTDGVGITTITSGQPTIEEDKTVTPVTVTKTDGSSQRFNVEAKNGIDGQNGKDGTNGQDGTTPDIQIGIVETLESNEYATVTRTGTNEQPVFNFGIPKGEKGNPGEVTEETLDKLMPKYTESGEIVSVDDAIAYKTFNVTVDGASEQETTTGKNLLPYPYVDTTKTENGITFTDNGDGTITVNGTATAGTFFKVFATQTNQKEIPGNYISGSVTGCNIVVAHREDSKYTSLGISTNGNSSLINKGLYDIGYVELSILQGVTLNNVIVRPMLTLEQDTSYEPYTGGQPSPSPDYPQEITTLTFDKITRCGKNLYYGTSDNYSFTSNKASWYFVNGDNGANGTNVGNKTLYKGLVKEGETYTFKANVNGTIGNMALIYDDESNIYGSSTIWDEYTFTAKKDGYVLLRLWISIPNEIQISNVQLEQGSQATEYEPYQATEYAIDLQGNEMAEIPNGVKDELVIDKYGNVNLIKNVGKYFFDGSEDWSSIPDTDTYWEFMYIFPTGNQANYTYSLSNYFSNEDYNRLICTGLEVYIRFPKNIGIDVSDAEKFKSWLQSHNTIAYYQLANPQPISLGRLSDIITTLNGTNNISINGNIPTTISTTYALDIKKYIDNKLAEISSALIEEG